MKKVAYLFIVLFAMTISLEAGQCSGGGTVYVCGASQQQQVEDDALANCCGGSSVVWEDVCTGESGTIDVLVDGPNSSCSVE